MSKLAQISNIDKVLKLSVYEMADYVPVSVKYAVNNETKGTINQILQKSHIYHCFDVILVLINYVHWIAKTNVFSSFWNGPCKKTMTISLSISVNPFQLL